MMLLNAQMEEDYLSFLESSQKGHFMQTPMWVKVKDNWKNEVIVVLDDHGKMKGSMSILIRAVPVIKRTIMYCGRGPVWDVSDEDTFLTLIEEAKLLAKKYKSYVLKLDPDIETSNHAFMALAKKAGFTMQSDSKNFEGIQPRFVFRLDIEGKTEDEIFAAFHSKTRYNIRVAQKNNVEVLTGARKDLKRFHEIMVETGQRDGFVIRTLTYFEKMYDNLAPNYLKLFVAKHEGNIVAGTIAIKFAGKVWYLYGASSNKSRNVMPNYLIQWEMIKWAIQSGCAIYDFRGVSGDLSQDNPLYGLYRFKKGFGGKFTEFVGELDLVFNPVVKQCIEKSEKLFRNSRRKIRVLLKRV